jgi:hypothetical protein
VVAVTGNKRHQVEFVSESYGGSKASKGSCKTKKASSATKSVESRPDVPAREHLLGSGSDTDINTSSDPGEVVVVGEAPRLTTREITMYGKTSEVTTYGRTSRASSMESAVPFSHVRIASMRNYDVSLIRNDKCDCMS